MRINYFWQITFSLYRLSVLALPRATESHRRKGKNGREGPAVACFRYCTLPPEREPSLSAHPSPPCCKSPSPAGTWCKEARQRAPEVDPARSDRGGAPASRCGDDGKIRLGCGLDEAAANSGSSSLTEKGNGTEM